MEFEYSKVILKKIGSDFLSKLIASDDIISRSFIIGDHNRDLSYYDLYKIWTDSDDNIKSFFKEIGLDLTGVVIKDVNGNHVSNINLKDKFSNIFGKLIFKEINPIHLLSDDFLDTYSIEPSLKDISLMVNSDIKDDNTFKRFVSSVESNVKNILDKNNNSKFMYQHINKHLDELYLYSITNIDSIKPLSYIKEKRRNRTMILQISFIPMTVEQIDNDKLVEDDEYDENALTGYVYHSETSERVYYIHNGNIIEMPRKYREGSAGICIYQNNKICFEYDITNLPKNTFFKSVTAARSFLSKTKKMVEDEHIDELNKEIDLLKRDLDRSNDTNNTLYDKINKLNNKIRKLEIDLSKEKIKHINRDGEEAKKKKEEWEEPPSFLSRIKNILSELKESIGATLAIIAAGFGIFAYFS